MFARRVFYCMGQMQVASNQGQSCKDKWSKTCRRRRQETLALGSIYCRDKARLRIKKQRYQIQVLQPGTWFPTNMSAFSSLPCSLAQQPNKCWPVGYEQKWCVQLLSMSSNEGECTLLCPTYHPPPASGSWNVNRVIGDGATILYQEVNTRP